MWSIIKAFFRLKANAQVINAKKELPRVRTLKTSGLYNYKNAATHEIYCPGCEITHGFDQTWAFNQDFVNPTINPSLLIHDKNKICHSYIKNGYIQYLQDCTHHLKGRCVRLPPIDEK